jgi:hypothetical protein
LKNLNNIYVCRQQRATLKGIIRFLPSDPRKQTEDAPSSTKIRQIIETSPPDELAKNLRGIALHPELLVEFMKELPKPVKRVVCLEEEEEENDPKIPKDNVW